MRGMSCVVDFELMFFGLQTVPKYVFWTEDYPKTASGKIQKFKLQEEGERLVKEGKGLE